MANTIAKTPDSLQARRLTPRSTLTYLSLTQSVSCPPLGLLLPTFLSPSLPASWNPLSLSRDKSWLKISPLKNSSSTEPTQDYSFTPPSHVTPSLWRICVDSEYGGSTSPLFSNNSLLFPLPCPIPVSGLGLTQPLLPRSKDWHTSLCYSSPGHSDQLQDEQVTCISYRRVTPVIIPKLTRQRSSMPTRAWWCWRPSCHRTGCISHLRPHIQLKLSILSHVPRILCINWAEPDTVLLCMKVAKVTHAAAPH